MAATGAVRTEPWMARVVDVASRRRVPVGAGLRDTPDLPGRPCATALAPANSGRKPVLTCIAHQAYGCAPVARPGGSYVNSGPSEIASQKTRSLQSGSSHRSSSLTSRRAWEGVMLDYQAELAAAEEAMAMASSRQ